MKQEPIQCHILIPEGYLSLVMYTFKSISNNGIKDFILSPAMP